MKAQSKPSLTVPQEVARDPEKRWAWIQWQLKANARSFAEVARGEGVKKETLYQVKSSRYPRMERALSKALGIDVHLLFPDRYDAKGLPAPLVRGGNYATRKIVRPSKTGRNIQTRAAA